MKNIAKTIIYILSIFLVSCSVKRDDADGQAAETVNLANSGILNTGLLSMDGMLVMDSIVWIHSDVMGESLLYAYDMNGRLCAKGLGYGNGNDEILELSSLHRYCGQRPAIYDSRMGKVFSVIINDSSLILNAVYDSLRMMDDVVGISGGDTILILPVNSDVSYRLMEKSKGTIAELSYFPPMPDGMDEKVHQLACTGMLAFSPYDNTFVRAVVYDGGLDFFRIRNGCIEHVKRSSRFDMSYKSLDINGNMLPVPSDSSRIGYSYVYATSDFFYASFSNSKLSDNPEGVASEIHVFDHEGNLHKKFVLEAPIGVFAVTEDDSQLFACVYGEDECVIHSYMLEQ